MLNNNNISYKISVTISPKWTEIFRYVFPDLQNIEDMELRSIIKSKLESIDKFQLSLCNEQDFKFDEIFDCVSGLRFIWSDYKKEFVDEIAVWGHLIDGLSHDDKLISNCKNNLPFRLMVISPYVLGFKGDNESDPPSYPIPKDNVIYSFPFFEIVQFFQNLQRELIDNGRNISKTFLTRKIKRFPKSLQDFLVKNNIEYDAYSIFGYTNENSLIFKPKSNDMIGAEVFEDIDVSKHYFESPFCLISLRFNFFQKNENNFGNSSTPSWTPLI